MVTGGSLGNYRCFRPRAKLRAWDCIYQEIPRVVLQDWASFSLIDISCAFVVPGMTLASNVGRHGTKLGRLFGDQCADSSGLTEHTFHLSLSYIAAQELHLVLD